MSPFCTYCGTEVEDSWNLCPNCGKKLRETEIPQNQVQPRLNPYQQTQQTFRNPYQQPPVQPYQKIYKAGIGYSYGIASLICGILGIVLGFFFIGFILGIPAIILGSLGISRDENSALGAIGLVLGVIDFIFGFVFFFFLWFPWFWFPW
ncbi:MAG: zinc-ribbon domain-containing protein [Promethearchaeota archaeon]|nr:MAG: zinc-ribbon domain-containing protein [Candidatus Lokiarchaeota archaeon]